MLMMITPKKIKLNYKNEIMKLLEIVGLNDHANSHVKSFSFGMKQRLALAQALIADAKLLILDEPFVGLDPLGIEFMKSKLITLCKDKGVSIIYSSHQLAEVAELSDDIIVLNGGKIGYCGSYQALVNKNKKYHIILDRPLCDTEILRKYKQEDHLKGNQISIDYHLNLLDTVMRDIQSSGYFIRDIQIEENSLLKLFGE